MPFVVDASATLPWCFEHEATSWTEGFLDRLSAGEQVTVPAHWPVEVANSLLTAVRRKRIPLDRALWFLGKLSELPILVEPPLTSTQINEVFTLCTKHGLTFYDGAYLELAIRTALPIATFDDAILKAAPVEFVAFVL